MSTEVALFEAKNRLSELVDRVLAGERIVITRRGKAVAQLSAPDGADTVAAQQAVRKLKASRKGVTLGGLSSRELVKEGRR